MNDVAVWYVPYWLQPYLNVCTYILRRSNVFSIRIAQAEMSSNLDEEQMGIPLSQLSPVSVTTNTSPPTGPELNTSPPTTEVHLQTEDVQTGDSSSSEVSDCFPGHISPNLSSVTHEIDPIPAIDQAHSGRVNQSPALSPGHIARANETVRPLEATEAVYSQRPDQSAQPVIAAIAPERGSGDGHVRPAMETLDTNRTAKYMRVIPNHELSYSR